jgi:CTP synthase (UTP-ammonia lyase)
MTLSRNQAKIALVGDYTPTVIPHRAIPLALGLALRQLPQLQWEWVATRSIQNAGRNLAGFSAVWVVPNSPYENMAGVLDAIRWARENRLPTLGTCGGFQHMLIEYARNVAGIAEAEHEESNPDAGQLLVARLACSLVQQSRPVHLRAGTRLQSIYDRESTPGEYQCNYGMNERYRAALEKAGLVFSGVDDAGEVRAMELKPPDHPFFIGTLFQPERAALAGNLSPLILAFVEAAVKI